MEKIKVLLSEETTNKCRHSTVHINKVGMLEIAKCKICNKDVTYELMDKLNEVRNC